MSGERRVCDRCSFVGDERTVRTRLVSYDKPQLVEVEIGSTRETVPALYGAEFRCVDRAGCEERAAPGVGSPHGELEPRRSGRKELAHIRADDEPPVPEDLFA